VLAAEARRERHHIQIGTPERWRWNPLACRADVLGAKGVADDYQIMRHPDETGVGENLRGHARDAHPDHWLKRNGNQCVLSQVGLQQPLANCSTLSLDPAMWLRIRFAASSGSRRAMAPRISWCSRDGTSP